MQTIQAALQNGTKTSVDLVYEARARMAALEHTGPCLNAVLEVNPQAEGLAMAADAARRAGRVQGPLHGVPILVKDNIDTSDMMHTSAGSLALAGRYAPRDAAVAAKLRAAGAILLGKANMTEFANFMADHMPNGYSSRGGQVVSPWGRDVDPSGSSTGSAVAVAAGYVPVAIGTETFGSIISPACDAGIVAIKPTVGVVSRAGILPISVTQDTAGPMGRSVRDCAAVLDVIAGADPDDPYTLHGQPMGGYVQATLAPALEGPRPLAGLRMGLVDEAYFNTPPAPAYHAALDTLRALGAELVAVAMPAMPWDAERDILLHEFRACMDAALKDSRGSVQTLAEIAAHNRAHRDTCLRHGQGLIERALWPNVSMASAAYAQAKACMRDTFIAPLAALFAREGLCAILTPNCHTFAVACLPSVALPVGMHENRPVPLVLNGPAFAEHTLLYVAQALETAVGPGMLPPL